MATNRKKAVVHVSIFVIFLDLLEGVNVSWSLEFNVNANPGLDDLMSAVEEC